MRTLLVDDQPRFLAAARAVVERTPGIEVVGEAGDGQEAIELAARLRPDLVVMDITMPVLDGVAACREITHAPDAPVVVLVSTYDRDDLPEEVGRSGAAAYLHKEELVPARLAELWVLHGRTLDA